MHAGTQNYAKSVDSGVWMHGMLHDSERPPPFYKQDFKEEADALLKASFDMTHEQITVSNMVGIYCHLVANM